MDGTQKLTPKPWPPMIIPTTTGLPDFETTTAKPEDDDLDLVKPGNLRWPAIVIGTVLIVLTVACVYICWNRIKACLCCESGGSTSELRKPHKVSPQPHSPESNPVTTTTPQLNSINIDAVRKTSPSPRVYSRLPTNTNFVTRAPPAITDTRPTVEATRKVAQTAEIITNILTADGGRYHRRK